MTFNIIVYGLVVLSSVLNIWAVILSRRARKESEKAYKREVESYEDETL